LQWTTLGGSGLRIPRVAVGCRWLGARQTGSEANAFVRAAVDLGLTFFDTADVYADGESERLLGSALAGERNRCVIATKVRHLAPHAGASRKSIRLALEGSLRRLGTDYVDLLQLHGPDPATPIEETIMTLQDLVQEGKVLYFGLCNVAAWQIVDAQRVAWGAARAPVVSVQVQINAVDPAKLSDLRPIAHRFKVGLLAASPLARGLLGGRYDRARPPPAGHPLLSNKGIGYWNERGFAALQRVREVAGALGISPARAALAALLSFPEISAVIVGAGDREQLAECCHVDVGTLDELLLRTVLAAPSNLPPSNADC
jgi:aryl-alcohol dehydrogenase-like predicted oxidoreductase